MSPKSATPGSLAPNPARPTPSNRPAQPARSAFIPQPARPALDGNLRKWWRELGPLVQFGIIYEQKSITGAADHLGLTKSTVSESLGKVEALRGRLFDRDTWVPTALGEHLYRHVVKPMLDVIRAAAFDMTGEGPVLELGASEYIIQEYLLPLLAAFRLQVPSLRIELHSGHRRDLEAKLGNGTIQLAILTVDKPDPSFVAHELLQRRATLLVPASCRARTAAELLTKKPWPYALACPPAAEGVSQVFLDHLDALETEWRITVGTCCTALMPFAVANGDTFGPCVDVTSLVTHPGVRALPLAEVPPLKVIAQTRGAPTGVLKQLLANITQLAQAMVKEMEGRAAAPRGSRLRRSLEF